jgi:hypothetical protein
MMPQVILQDEDLIKTEIDAANKTSWCDNIGLIK